MWYSPDFNQVFFSHSDLRRFYVGGDDGRPFIVFPQVITDDHLAFINVWPLVYEMPEVGANQVAEPTTVLEVNGQWVQQWVVRDVEPVDLEPVDPEPEEPVQSDEQSAQP